MATQSIMKNIVIRDEKSAVAFVEALEKAAASDKQPVSSGYTVTQIKGADVRKFFEQDV